jgi:hypothetical protein
MTRRDTGRAGHCSAQERCVQRSAGTQVLRHTGRCSVQARVCYVQRCRLRSQGSSNQ